MPKDPKNPTDRDREAASKLKAELEKVGIKKIVNLGDDLESLEDCILKATIWIPKENNKYGMKIAKPFFTELVKGPDDAGGEIDTVAGDKDDIEY